jgi:hypothetical protein
MNDLDKQLITYLRDNKITMDEYVNISNLDIININKYHNIINTFDDKLKQTLYEQNKTLLKYKDNKVIFKNKIIFDRIIGKSSIEFTQNQKEAINELTRFLSKSNDKIYGLFGYAGTGKTTTIVELIKILLTQKYIKSIIFTAPTNKALNVIKNKFALVMQEIFKFLDIEIDNTNSFETNLEKLKKYKINIDFATIHRLMKYKTEFNIDGEMIFVREKDNLLDNYDIVIIDECSMVSINLIFDIISEINKFKTKILFLGDPAQLPPVNERFSSVFMNKKNVLSIENIKKYIVNINKEKYDILRDTIISMNIFVLKEVIRTKNHSIINACNLIRDWIFNSDDFYNISKYCDDNFKIFPFDKTLKTNTEWYKLFESTIKTESDTIIITWTNDETHKYNDYCRKLLFNKSNLDKYVIGDILILNEFYNINSFKMNTSEKIIVNKIEIIDFQIEKLSDKLNKNIRVLKNYRPIETKYKNFIEYINSLGLNIKCYKLKVLKIDDNINYDINVIIDDEKEKHKNIITNMIEEIKKFRQNTIETTQLSSIDNLLIQPLWKEFYSKYIDPFASVSYGYAITCHKAQGSNYKNVFVDFADISKNRNEDEMKRCMYTAMSRTIDNLYIIV